MLGCAWALRVSLTLSSSSSSSSLKDSSDPECETKRIRGWSEGDCCRVDVSDASSTFVDGGVINGGRSLGTLGSGLFAAMFRNERAASRELEEFRDEDRLATYCKETVSECYQMVTYKWPDFEIVNHCQKEQHTILRRLAAPHRFSISLQ